MTDAIASLVIDSLRATVIFAAAWFAALALRRASASTRHMVWSGAIVAALLMPAVLSVAAWRVTVPSPLARWPLPVEPDGARDAGVAKTPLPVTGAAAGPAVGRAEPEAASSSPASSTTSFVIVAVWITGFVAILLRFVAGVIVTSRLRRAVRRLRPSWSNTGQELARAHGIGGVTFTESAALSTPLVCGVVRPAVIMPVSASLWPAVQLHAVLLHELSHVRRRDCLTQMLSRLTCAIYWFHPLAWLAAYRLRVEREHACDDFVLLSGVRASAYAQCLVDVARAAVSKTSILAPAGVAMAQSARLEGRLMSILNPEILRTSSRTARLGVVVFILGALATASLQVEAQAPAPAQAAPASNVTFEVASIRRNPDDEAARARILQKAPNSPIPPGRAQTLPGGNFVGRGMSVREMIRDAYGYRNRAAADVVGGPDWIDSERYNIQAKAAVEFPLSSVMGLPPMAESALRALLADRMNLLVRFESRPRRVYEMTMAREDKRLGPNLTPSKGGCRSFYAREAITTNTVTVPDPAGVEKPIPLRPCMMGIALSGVIAENLTMEEWARLLAALPQLDTTVIDRTGLTGAFDFRVMNQTPENPALPDVMPLLEDQLGIKLRRVEAPVEVLVIERVERPTDN